LWVKAGVTTYRFFEALLVAREKIGGLVQRNQTRIEMLNVERFDEAVESKPIHWIFTGE